MEEKLNILIVEDSAVCRSGIQRLMSSYGQCDIAKDGAEGVEAVEAILTDSGKSYDLICLDSIMPNMSGLEALVKIHDIESQNGFPIGRGAKVLMMTGQDDHKIIMEFFNNGCDGYIVKPVRLPAILEKMKEFDLISE